MSLAGSLGLGGRWTWVGGKGGVGKTTVAAAMAVELADAGEAITLLSTDPAHSLGDAFDLPLGPEPKPHPDLPGLYLLEIDAEHERQAFLREHSSSISTLLSRGTYLDDADIAQVTGMTVPGMDELAALLRLSRLDRETEGRLIIDTAPTGHTLRLLALPEVALGWLDALGSMQARHDAIATAFRGGTSEDDVTRFLDRLRAELEGTARRLRSATDTRFVVVTTSEPVVLAESRRLADRLDRMGIALGGIVVNRARSEPRVQMAEAGMVRIPPLAAAPVGTDGLRGFARMAGRDRVADDVRPSGRSVEISPEPLAVPTDRELYFVAGKGGVGKSTAAAALAIRLTRTAGRKVLLLSVDPAGSLGDVLDAEVDGEARPLSDAAGLWTQQLDAEGAWQEFREDYSQQVDAVFEGLLGSNLSAEHDRQVMDRLLDLAPPGIDELMALMEVVDTKKDALYDAIVVDTAPTGHFLRLIQMPALALEWCHTLLSLLLKYREVIALGGLAERVLKLSRSLREMGEVLRDERTWTLLVALPEALSIPETRRLIDGLRAMGIEPGALLVNRYRPGDHAGAPPEMPALVDAARGLPVGIAPLLDDGPVGVVQLGDFGGSWRRVVHHPAAA